MLAYDRATGRGVVLSYDFAWKGKSTEGLPRETAESVYAKTPRQGFADHAPGEYQATVETARAAFARGDLFEAVPGQLVRRALRAFAGRSVPAAVPHQSVALWRADESRRRRISGVGLAGNVRALRRTAGRDLSDLGHHRARRRCDRRCRADPPAAELGKGRIRTQHVHRRRPQRQGAGLRARHDQGAGAAADRDLFEAVSHRRPCRRHAAARLRLARCVPDPCLGGDGDRRAETVGDAVRRGQRALVAALVCRRDRRGEFRRQHQHRAHHPHHPHEGWSRRSARRRHLPVRLRSRRRRSRMPGQGGGAVPGAARRSAKAAVGVCARRHRFGQEGAPDRSRRQLRAHAGGLFPPGRRRRHRGPPCPCAGHAEEEVGSAGAVAGTGTAGGFRDFENHRHGARQQAADLRRLSRRAGDRRIFWRPARSTRPARARTAVASPGARRAADAEPAERNRDRPLSFALCRARQHARRARGHRDHRGRRRDGDRTQDRCRSAACSFIRNR